MCGYLIHNSVIFCVLKALKRNPEFLHYANNVGSLARLGPRQAGVSVVVPGGPNSASTVGFQESVERWETGLSWAHLGGGSSTGVLGTAPAFFNEIFTHPFPAYRQGYPLKPQMIDMSNPVTSVAFILGMPANLAKAWATGIRVFCVSLWWLAGPWIAFLISKA